MRHVLLAAVAAACIVPAAASAQDVAAPSSAPYGTPYADPVANPAPASATYASTSSDDVPADIVAGSFGGVRIEGNVGWDKMQAYGRNNEKLGYGGSAGFDGNLTKQIIVGPEVNYWRPNGGHSYVTAPDGGAVQEGRDIWGAAVRIGVRAGPDLIVFGKGGYAQQSQRTYFTQLDGSVSRTSGHADGYQVGGGFQYAPHDRFSFAPANLYLSGQYVYSNFVNHTVDQHAMAGVGFRFR